MSDTCEESYRLWKSGDDRSFSCAEDVIHGLELDVAFWKSKLAAANDAVVTFKRELDKNEADTETLHARIAELEKPTSDMLIAGHDAMEKELNQMIHHPVIAKIHAAMLTRIQSVVDAQAKDEALWFVAQTAPEGYLQAQLRVLHAAIEGEKK